MYRSAVISAILFCLTLSSSLLAQAPLVINSSFELEEDMPESWRILPRYPYERYLWDREVAHSGDRSISIRGTGYRYGRWKSEKSSVSQDGYTWYTLAGYARTQRNVGEVYLAIAWYDKAGKLITTSDSDMLPFGDSDWQQVTVSALPPQGAAQMELWCISNNNVGQSWFDDLELTIQQLPARQKTASGKPSDAPYDQFLREYPRHPFALTAHDMRLKSLYTQGKWKKERSHHHPEDKEEAVRLFAQAAAVPRLDDALSQGGRRSR